MRMKKRGLLGSVLKLKCPKCREGDLFKKHGYFVFKNILDMPEQCDVCGQKFEIEPGFWIGALWVSYPFVIGIISPFIFLMLYFPMTYLWGIIMIILVLPLFLLYSLVLRLGRSIWISIFVKYNPPFKNKLKL